MHRDQRDTPQEPVAAEQSDAEYAAPALSYLGSFKELTAIGGSLNSDGETPS